VETPTIIALAPKIVGEASTIGVDAPMIARPAPTIVGDAPAVNGVTSTIRGDTPAIAGTATMIGGFVPTIRLFRKACCNQRTAPPGTQTGPHDTADATRLAVKVIFGP